MSPKKSSRSSIPRTTALCYIRQSFTRNPSDMDSPERQRANIEQRVLAKGWIPEWYADAEGHKSGTQENNRPGWLGLRARLSDPDVVAVVANDLARMHRKGWRVGQLIDLLEEHGVFLVLTAPGRDLDLSKPQDRIAIQIIAMIDEWYAEDASLRQKDNVNHRKRQGKSVGIPPFGSWRDEDGYLVPSPRGAWWLPDGSHVAGMRGEEPPVTGAIWRGYFECAEQILLRYTPNKQGQEGIALDLNTDGWVFRDRNGRPRPVERDDVRRVISNWREYAGLVMGGRAKDQYAARIEDPASVLHETGHNVFPLDLLRQVAEVQADRSITRNSVSPKGEAYDYVLAGLLYCAHCERTATEANNPRLRNRISGHGPHENRRYRHKEGRPCAGESRSVPIDFVEDDFNRLIHLLAVDENALPLLVELDIQSQQRDLRRDGEADPEAEKREAIEKCRRRIEAARYLYEDGDLTREEYLRRKEQNEREIAHWETRTSDTEQAVLELALCIETIQKIGRSWDHASPEDRQGMARFLFETVFYDLDTRRITDFRLKPWADRFLVLRAALYENENGARNGAVSDENNLLKDRTVLCPQAYWK